MMDYLLAYLNDEMSLDKALMCVRDKIFGGGLAASSASSLVSSLLYLSFRLPPSLPSYSFSSWNLP